MIDQISYFGFLQEAFTHYSFSWGEGRDSNPRIISELEPQPSRFDRLHTNTMLEPLTFILDLLNGTIQHQITCLKAEGVGNDPTQP